jgi:uncharacterized membrane protein HdeD (DUF308 family)
MVERDENETWDQRLRQHPAVVVVAAVLAIMAGFSILHEFFTNTLPWMLGFLGPVGLALGPVSRFLSENAEPASFVGTFVLMMAMAFWIVVRGIREQREYEELGRIARGHHGVRRD